jgi:GLPGLI family protein
MKRSIISGAGFLLLALAAQAQKPDTAQVLVHYKFTHVRDTADRAHPYTENMVLFVGKSASAYRSYDGVVADEQFKKAYIAAGGTFDNRHLAGSRTQYYQYPNEQKLVTKDNLLSNEYQIAGPMPAIDWQISGDTATFDGVHCQKATGHFKGRDYIVWFCPDLPVHTGPWKLNGLPGVIVDAHDTKNEVVFQFDGLEKAVFTEVSPITGANAAEKDVDPILWDLDDNPTIIAPPARTIKATQAEYDKLKAGMQKNPNAVAAANRANGMGDIRMIAKPGPRRVENNPIELPEKN